MQVTMKKVGQKVTTAERAFATKPKFKQERAVSKGVV